MSKKPMRRVRGGGTPQEDQSVVQFFDWESSDPTHYGGLDGLTEELVTDKNRLSDLLRHEGEIRVTVPDAIEVIRQVRREVGDAVGLGAGTVLDPETARAALLSGAEYIVASSLNLEVIRLCRRYDKVVMPGALTPTEVVAA